MKILFFLLMNGLGFISISLMTLFADARGMIPDLPPELLRDFQVLFFGGTMLSWIISGIASILYLFMSGIVRYVFLALPIIIPVIYALFVLNSYSTN